MLLLRASIFFLRWGPAGGNQNRLEGNEYCVCIILNLKNPIRFKMYLTLAEGDMLSGPLKCSHDPVRVAIKKELSGSDGYHFQGKALRSNEWSQCGGL